MTELPPGMTPEMEEVWEFHMRLPARWQARVCVDLARLMFKDAGVEPTPGELAAGAVEVQHAIREGRDLCELKFAAKMRVDKPRVHYAAKMPEKDGG